MEMQVTHAGQNHAHWWISSPTALYSGSQGKHKVFSPSFNNICRQMRTPACDLCRKSRSRIVYKARATDLSTCSGPTIVWFKNDLRISDHPGLEDALECGQDIIPLYCLDPVLVRSVLGFPGGVQLLHGALINLKRSLQERGSDLVVRVGELVPTVLDCVQLSGAVKISTEDEVDFRLRDAVDQVEASAAASVSRWRTSIWKPHEYSENYREFKKKRGMHRSPVSLESEFPAFNVLFGRGSVEVDSELEALLVKYQEELGITEDTKSLGRIPTLLWNEWMDGLTCGPNSASERLKEYLAFTDSNDAQRMNGETAPLDKFVEPLEESCLPGLSFPALFFPALSIGLLSPREIYSETVSAVTSKSQGFFSNFPSFGQNLALLKSVACDCDVVDFHYHLATSLGSTQLTFWKWKGIVIEFTRSVPEDTNDDSPVVLLVHGFGASSFHWRRNVESLKQAGNIVYCITIPGFGRTQKSSLLYSQYVWTACIVDFIKDVIRKPVVLAGNSIGGYTAASVAGNHRELVQGLVLLNSAGPVVPEYEPRSNQASDQSSRSVPKFVVDLVSKALLIYLEKSAKSTLKSLYPVNPRNADEELLEEILRAGCDPNADSVLKSVFFLKSPIPLNYHISDGFGGPVLILQGCLDPLGDAEGKAKLLQSLCDGLQVKLLEAGHCPHDEVPEIVNNEIISFIQKLEKKPSLVPQANVPA